MIPKIAARDLFDKIRLRLLSAIRETFTTLIYPHSDELFNADFLMNFTASMSIEASTKFGILCNQNKNLLNISSDTFRKKCEERLSPKKLWLGMKLKKELQ